MIIDYLSMKNHQMSVIVNSSITNFNQSTDIDYSEIGKAKQAYGPMAPGFQKLWAISKKYGPWQ